MKKELEIKKNILESIYNTFLNNNNENDYFNFYNDISQIINNNAIINNIYSLKDKQKILLKNIKESKKDIIKYIHEFLNYNVLIPNQFTCVFSKNSFDYLQLNLNKTKQYTNVIEKLYKTENQIKTEYNHIFNINVLELLSKFNFNDYIRITNEKNEELLLNKDVFITFICAMDFNSYENIILYEKEKDSKCYCINDNKIGIICKCL